jgi:hypothetical protein
MIMKKAEKNEYWRVVAECLIAYHGLEKGESLRRARAYRIDIENAEPYIQNDIFYHNEPFDVACDLTQHYLELEPRFPEYEQILEGKGHSTKRQ